MIALSEPNLGGNEWSYIKECLDTNWVSSVGKFVNQFESVVAKFCHTRYAVATSNGTTALHLSLLLAGTRPGDLILAPNVTFVASINSIKYALAEPVLIDVSAGSWQMNLDLVEEFLRNNCEVKGKNCLHKKSGKTVRGILPVHVLGNIGNMDRLINLATEFKLFVIEDATESLGSTYKSIPAGSFGLMGCLSFNGNKIITTGGGGMIITNDEVLAKKAKHLSTQAKADPNEYYHDEVGYNYRLVNILAAMGVAQMEQLPDFIRKKKEIAAYYNDTLEKIPGIQSQEIHGDVDCNHWLYTIRVPHQKELRRFLRENQVDARPFWVPMNQLPPYKNCIYFQKENISERVYKECLSLPCSTNITKENLELVASLVLKFYHD